MVICPENGRHFRGFVGDQTFVAGVLARLEGHTQVEQREVDLDDSGQTSKPSKTAQGGGCKQ